MADATDLERLALAIPGTTAAPHFDRTAFKIHRIYATLAADRRSANLKFQPDEQALKCTTAPDAFAPVQNAWGRQGWTTVTLAQVSARELEAALKTAAAHAVKPPARKRRSLKR